MRQFLRNNSLSLALLGLFAMFWVGQSIAGWMDYNQDEKSEHPHLVLEDPFAQGKDLASSDCDFWDEQYKPATPPAGM